MSWHNVWVTHSMNTPMQQLYMVHIPTSPWFGSQGPPHACFMVFLNSTSEIYPHISSQYPCKCSSLPSPHLNTSNQLAESTFPPERAVLWILSSLPEISSSSLQQMKFLVTRLQVTNLATSWYIQPSPSFLFYFFLHMLQLVTLESLVKKRKRSPYIFGVELKPLGSAVEKDVRHFTNLDIVFPVLIIHNPEKWGCVEWSLNTILCYKRCSYVKTQIGQIRDTDVWLLCLLTCSAWVRTDLYVKSGFFMEWMVSIVGPKRLNP